MQNQRSVDDTLKKEFSDARAEWRGNFAIQWRWRKEEEEGCSRSLAPSLPRWQEAEKEDFGTLSLTLLFSSPLHRRQTETTLLTMQAHAPPRLQSDLLAWTIGFVDPSLAVGHMPRGYWFPSLVNKIDTVFMKSRIMGPNVQNHDNDGTWQKSTTQPLSWSEEPLCTKEGCAPRSCPWSWRRKWTDRGDSQKEWVGTFLWEDSGSGRSFTCYSEYCITLQ